MLITYPDGREAIYPFNLDLFRAFSILARVHGFKVEII